MTAAEWVDAFDEAAWLGTPAPPRDAPAAWGPWDVHAAWGDYREHQARRFRNARHLPVRCHETEGTMRRLRLIRGRAEPIHYNRLGDRDVLYHSRGQCLGVREGEPEDPDPDRHLVLRRTCITGSGPAGSSAGRMAAGSSSGRTGSLPLA